MLGAPAVERTAVGPEEALEGVAEVEGEVPALAALGLAARMEGLADGWTRLAGSLRELGEAAAHAVPPGVLARVRALAEGERRFFEDVGAALAWRSPHRSRRPGSGSRASRATSRSRSTGSPFSRWRSTISGTSAGVTPPYQTPSG